MRASSKRLASASSSSALMRALDIAQDNLHRQLPLVDHAGARGLNEDDLSVKTQEA